MAPVRYLIICKRSQNAEIRK